MIARDKVIHAVAGFIIALATIWIVPWLSVLTVLVAAIGKEVYDYLRPAHHVCDPWDAAATVIGALPVWVVWGLL